MINSPTTSFTTKRNIFHQIFKYFPTKEKQTFRNNYFSSKYSYEMLHWCYFHLKMLFYTKIYFQLIKQPLYKNSTPRDVYYKQYSIQSKSGRKVCVSSTRPCFYIYTYSWFHKHTRKHVVKKYVDTQAQKLLRTHWCHFQLKIKEFKSLQTTKLDLYLHHKLFFHGRTLKKYTYLTTAYKF